MNTLRLRLEARAPALRCHRAYDVTVGQDLFVSDAPRPSWSILADYAGLA